MQDSSTNNKDIPERRGSTRREFIAQVSAIGAGFSFVKTAKANGVPLKAWLKPEDGAVNITLLVNGKSRSLQIDPRVTLLDALRNYLQLPGTKKGCDRGQCGACTVLVNGRRINSCLTLAVMCEGQQITTIEGLGTPDKLHPMQQAFLEHDAFQCGYCTPGQICSAVGLLKEGHASNDEQIKEGMSGNICRCGAYQNILDAIKSMKA